jgi:hypothetical protein
MIKEHRFIAEKTLKAIEDTINKDQGSSFRYFSGQTIPNLKDPYDPDNTPFRSHLGASLIGGKCDRDLWYGFRWYKVSNHSGQLLRLFNRGHLEEGRFIAALMSIGATVYQYDQNGKQYKVSYLDGHFGGSTDGIAIGIPEVPNEYVLTEFKTHSEKSFKKLDNEGVRKAKFEHFVQMQIYMYEFRIRLALYMAVNKNTDEIYAEFIQADDNVARIYIERAKNIIDSPKPPKKISNNASWYECKFCSHHGICHEDETPALNCRTCMWSNPAKEATWVCNKFNCVIDKAQQLTGCPKWERR